MQRLSTLYSARQVQANASAYTRTLWTTRTIVADSPETLVAGLPSIQQAKDSSLALFSVSRNVPASSLSKLVKHFQDLPSKAVGCLSYGNEEGTSPYTLAYALYTPSSSHLEVVVPFRSVIAGTSKVILGREVSQIEKHVENAEWAGDASVAAELLPEELRGLRYI